MILSLGFLNYCTKKPTKVIYVKNDKNDKNDNNDNNSYNEKIHSLEEGIEYGYNVGMLSIGIMFLVLELLLLFYCIGIAIKCSKPGPERVVHVLLAITFTLPYALLNVLFNSCAKDFLTKK